MSIIDTLAIVGAFSGVSSILWNFYQWQQSKPKLKISAAITTRIQGGIATEGVLMVKMVNAGKKPIHIEMIRGKTTKSDFFICPVNLPTTLQESQTCTEAYDEAISMMVGEQYLLIELYAVDSLEKRWQVSSEDIVKINIHIANLRKIDLFASNME